MAHTSSAIDLVRSDRSEATKHRRDIATLSALGLLDFTLISLFQLGKIKELPDLPGEVFDSKQVNRSEDAVIFGIPDGPISLAGYATTMLLATAAIGSKRNSRLFDLGLAGVLLGQAAGAAHYMYRMTFVQKRVCLYCLAGALINFTSLVPMSRLLKNHGR